MPCLAPSSLRSVFRPRALPIRAVLLPTAATTIARMAADIAMAGQHEARHLPNDRSAFRAMCILPIVQPPALPELHRCGSVPPAMAAIWTAMGTGSVANDPDVRPRRVLGIPGRQDIMPSAGGCAGLTDDQHIWACALAIETQYGTKAPLHVAERIGTLAQAGDADGVAMWQAIALRLDRLRGGDTSDRKRPDRQ